MDVLFAPCKTLKEIGIDTDHIEHQYAGTTRLLIIKYEQKNQVIVLVEFPPGTSFSDIYEEIVKAVSLDKIHTRPITLRINMDLFDILSLNNTELDQLSLFILDFNECLDNITRDYTACN